MLQNHTSTPAPTVLHVAQPVEGGVARVVLDLVRTQREAGLRPVLACPPHGALAPAAEASGALVLPWDAGREPGRSLGRECASLAGVLRAAAPDLVHAHSSKAGLAARLVLRGRLPTVFQPHAWSFDAVTGPRRALALRWERRAAGWTARVLCVSEDERRRGLDAGITARTTVVRNGADLTRFTPAGPAEAAAHRAALTGLDVATPLVVCVGRLCAQKGQDLLLRAWPEVRAAVPGARLALVGGGPDAAELRRQAPADVLMPGHADDVRAWYAVADVVVLPSRWEGMALAPLEAMACGRPVLLTDVTGARESLPPGHAATNLVPPAHPRALAGALARLLAERAVPLRARLGSESARYARDVHDVRRTGRAVGELYREVLGLRPAVPPSVARAAGEAPPDAGGTAPGAGPRTGEHAPR